MLLNSLNLNQNTIVISSLAVLLLAGFLLTRLTKLVKLPSVTGYIFAGIMIGPYVLHLIPDDITANMGFVTDVALAFIAFGVGRYFKISDLRKSGSRVFVITLFESLFAGLVITVTMIFLFHLSVPFSILLGAIGCATAPASTLMTIRQYHAKGEFVKTLIQVVALDDAVALIAFSVCAAAAQTIGVDEGGFSASVVLLPVLYNILVVLLGIVLGFVLHLLVRGGRSKDNRLILSITAILLMSGLCCAVDISPLLSCMAIGAAYINCSKDKDLFKQVNNFTPPVLVFFFVLSGMRLDIYSLKTAGIIGVVYFFVRIIGKCAGSYLGALFSHAPKEIRNYMGLALIPQAGVSIGLAVLGQRLLPAEAGNMLSTIILSSAVLYEMIGPACAKASLFLAKVIQPEDMAKKEKKKKSVPEPELDSTPTALGTLEPANTMAAETSTVQAGDPPQPTAEKEEIREPVPITAISH